MRLSGASFHADQRGASTVEFAILTPLIFMIVFGMLTGGLAWNRKQVLSHSARETARFGATYPVDDIDDWTGQTLTRARDEAFNGKWPIGKYGYLCVAYQYPDGEWWRQIQEGSDLDGTPPAPNTAAAESGACPLDDDRPSSEPHVQVLIREDVFLNAILMSGDVRLVSGALARHEVSQ